MKAGAERAGLLDESSTGRQELQADAKKEAEYLSEAAEGHGVPSSNEQSEVLSPSEARQGVSTLYDEYGDLLRYIARRRGHTSEEAEELLHDVMVRAAQAMLFRGFPDHPKAWLRRVLINLSIDMRRGRGPKLLFVGSEAELPDDPDLEDDVAAEAEWEGLVEATREAIRGLRYHQRKAVELYYYGKNKITVREVAEILEADEQTVKTWLHRARAAIGMHLRERGWFDE